MVFRKNNSGMMNRKGGNGFYRKRRGEKRETKGEDKKDSKYKDNTPEFIERVGKHVKEMVKLVDAKEKYVNKYLETMKKPDESTIKGEARVGFLVKSCTDSYTGVTIGKGQCVLFWMTDTFKCKVVAGDGRTIFTDGANIRRVPFLFKPLK